MIARSQKGNTDRNMTDIRKDLLEVSMQRLPQGQEKGSTEMIIFSLRYITGKAPARAAALLQRASEIMTAARPQLTELMRLIVQQTITMAALSYGNEPSLRTQSVVNLHNRMGSALIQNARKTESYDRPRRTGGERDIDKI